jgi:hypothetical protein
LPFYQLELPFFEEIGRKSPKMGHFDTVFLDLCEKHRLFRYFAVYTVFEFCGVFKSFVYDFSASACQFGSDVFNDDFAVMLAVYEGFRVTQLLLFGFHFFAVCASASVIFEEGR